MDVLAQIKEFDHLGGIPCLYMLLVEPTFYKFGITCQIYDRLRAHLHNIKFIEVINVYKCPNKVIMSSTELSLKRFAKTQGNLVNKYGLTEIIQTDNIAMYIDYVTEMIAVKIRERAGMNPAVIDVVKIVDKVEVDNKKCYECGKVFRTPANLADHKNRKIPCIIQNVDPQHIQNPNRCIYCNKIFSKKANLVKHHNICKIKISGIVIHVDKVRYEQEIRVLKETIEKHGEDQKEEMNKHRIEFQSLINELRKQIVPGVNITNNITTK